ncbi:MAG: VWA domain-containing protein [Planctomycetota bacterium]|jgi:Mg-chelatase subunit ChlD
MRIFALVLLLALSSMADDAARFNELARSDNAESANTLVTMGVGLEKVFAQARSGIDVLRKKRRRLDETRRTAKDNRKRAKAQQSLDRVDRELSILERDLRAAEKRRVAVLGALAAMKSAETGRWMAGPGLERAKEPVLRKAVAKCVVRANAGNTDALLPALGKSKNTELAVPLLQVIAAHGGSEKAVPDVAAFLKNRDWAVRVAAAYALASIAKPACVEPIVAALQRAPNRSRELRELAGALTRLTGLKNGPYADVWKKWYEAEKINIKDGRVPLGKAARKSGKGAKAGDQGYFYGIPQNAERIIYVVDISGSMEVSLLNPQWIDGESVPARDDEDSRFDAALRELLRATRKLRPRSTFAVFLYSSQVRPLHEKMANATKANLSRLEQELATIGPAGSTNIHDSLEAALRFAGVYAPGTTGKIKQVADVIYLLSDGAPTTSKGKTEDPERTLAAVREWNAMKRIAIHTIGIGREHSRAFMQQLAEENGGQYYAVEPKKKNRKKKPR